MTRLMTRLVMPGLPLNRACLFEEVTDSLHRADRATNSESSVRIVAAPSRLRSSKGKWIARKRHTVEQIIWKHWKAAVGLGRGLATPPVCLRIGISVLTRYRWHTRHGVIQASRVEHLRELEQENARLKKVLAQSMMDKKILQEAASGDY